MKINAAKVAAWGRTLRLQPSYSGQTDEELAAKAAGGSDDHFEAIVRRYSTAIYRFAYRLCGSKSQAEDIVQETFIKVFRALPGARLDMPLRPWLYKIALNTAISMMRKRGDGEVALPANEPAIRSPGADEAVDRLDARAALGRLSRDYRQIVILRAVEDLAFSEIAAILSIPEATARTRYLRARAALKKDLSD